eukprot:439164-Pyramimonas_sp.AAC.1
MPRATVQQFVNLARLILGACDPRRPSQKGKKRGGKFSKGDEKKEGGDQDVCMDWAPGGAGTATPITSTRGAGPPPAQDMGPSEASGLPRDTGDGKGHAGRGGAEGDRPEHARAPVPEDEG